MRFDDTCGAHAPHAVRNCLAGLPAVSETFGTPFWLGRGRAPRRDEEAACGERVLSRAMVSVAAAGSAERTDRLVPAGGAPAFLKGPA
jgi:hypothetical protein